MIGVLVGLKLRLMLRTVARRGGWRTAVIFVVMAVILAPLWLGLSTLAHRSVQDHGPAGVATGLGLVHLGWIGISLIFGSYAEGFDLRLLLRYPIDPHRAFLFNVLISPVDVSALFLLPPLGTLIAATGAQAGIAAALVVGLAAGLLLLITGTLVQALMALLGHHLRREWTRAFIGLLLGLLFLLPALVIKSGAPANQGSGFLRGLARQFLPALADGFTFLPSTALPVRAAQAAMNHRFVVAGGFLVLGGAFLALLVRLCGHVALQEAMNRHVGSSDDGATKPRAVADGTPPPRRSAVFRALESALALCLPTDVALLVVRELRTYLRTPQVLLGLMTALPFVLVFVSTQSGASASDGPSIDILPFMLSLATLVAAQNIVSNQFGLDQAGVRLLFLLPVSTRRLIVAKNLACGIVAATAFGLCASASALMGHLTAATGASAFATFAAALPVVLIFGNRLSIRHPWRITHRIGGAPPGALVSGMAQMAGMAVVGLLLAPGLFVLPIVYAFEPWVQMASLTITAAIAAVLWTAWALLLPGAARAMDARREAIIDRLAHSNETG